MDLLLLRARVGQGLILQGIEEEMKKTEDSVKIKQRPFIYTHS